MAWRREIPWWNGPPASTLMPVRSGFLTGETPMRNFFLRALPALVLVMLITNSSGGMFMRPDLDKIPVERLAANLEEILKKDEKSRETLYNLARLHAMAYAQKTDTATFFKGREKNGAWFGFTPNAVPFKFEKTDDPMKQKDAEVQLKKALTRYDDTLKVDPAFLPAQLGKAWLLDQSGKKEEAVKGYRLIIDEAWKKEGTLKNGPLGGQFLTTEAAGYLKPLLDKEKDKEEIVALDEKTAKLAKLPRPVTPLVIPLVDNVKVSDLEDRNARVKFDGDGTGFLREWTWITPKGAWLVHDPKGQGQITSAVQMFGGNTFCLFWENGYHALAALDDNGDGELTGKELDGLALWHDANGNGICDPGEVKSLREYGIVALSVKFQRDPSHPDRIAFNPTGVRFADGKTRPTFDLILHSR
jgi:hypothetical protein